MSGASVVRAYEHEARFIKTMDSRVDDANRSLYYLWVTNQWLRVSMNTKVNLGFRNFSIRQISLEISRNFTEISVHLNRKRRFHYSMVTQSK